MCNALHFSIIHISSVSVQTAPSYHDMEAVTHQLDAASLERNPNSKSKLTFYDVPRELRLIILKAAFPLAPPKKQILKFQEISTWHDTIQNMLRQMTCLLAASRSFGNQHFIEASSIWPRKRPWTL